MEDKFKFFKKWFWIGALIALLNGVAGLIYGIALWAEPEHRKEGVFLTIWSLALTAAATYLFFRARRG